MIKKDLLNSVFTGTKNTDGLIEQFRRNYAEWAAKYPERAEKAQCKANLELCIRLIRRNIEELDKIAKETKYPWQWCIDYQTHDGEFFCPIWVIFGNARIYKMTLNGLRRKQIDIDFTLGHEGRYAVNNKYYPRTGSDPVERWVCNYFHEKPENFDIYRMEAGHNDPFDPTKSCEENNNMYNVSWQTSKENKSDQKKFEKGGYEKVIYENAHLKKEDVTYADWLKKNLTALSDPNISTFVRIERTGKIREDGTRFIKEFSFTQKHKEDSDEVAREKYKNFDKLKNWGKTGLITYEANVQNESD